MKIDDKDILSSSLQNIARTTQGNASTRATTDGVSAGAPSQGDAVDLSGRSTILTDALTAGESARGARIEQLRQLYVAGQHVVDSQELSGSIIDAHLVGA